MLAGRSPGEHKRNSAKMLTGRNIANKIAAIGARLVMVAMLVFCNAFFVRAHGIVASEDARVRVTFPFDNAELRSNYMQNDYALNSLRQLLDATDGNLDIQIVAYSSPEGNEQYNKALSARRAASIKSYVLSLFPDSKPSVKVTSYAESWDQFRAYIASDKSLDASSRSELLFLIDSDNTADEKEALIKADPNYKRLYSKYFRSLRYADISLRIANPAAIALFTKDSKADSPVVYFPTGTPKVVPSYMGNKANLEEMIAFFRENPSAADDFVIVGAASPEGPTSVNNRLALMRAKSMADYISERVPEVRGKLRIRCAGEDWSGLRAAVVAEDSLTDDQKQEICQIIDSSESADAKETALKKHPAYKAVREKCYPALRSQSIAPADSTVREKPVEEVVPAPVVVVKEKETVDTTSRKDTLSRLERLPAIRTKAVMMGESSPVERDSVVAVEPQKYVQEEVPVFAVSSNLLYDAVLAPNFAVEIPISKDRKWSVYGEYTFPWWLPKSNEWCYEMLKWDLGVRYHFGTFDREEPFDIFSGHFLGLNLSAGYYDFEPLHNGYQGEFQMIGLEYGYSWKLSDHWRLDTAIGGGWMATHYRYYEADATDTHLIYQHSGRLGWFGPTKAEVGLKYIFTHKQRRAVK